MQQVAFPELLKLNDCSMKVHALCNKFELAQSAVGTILKGMAECSKEVNNTSTMQTTDSYER